MINELVKIEETNVKALFTIKGIESLINQVRVGVDGFKSDVSTPAGRKECASIAYKVSQSKTYIEGFGKDLSTALKKESKTVDAARKYCKDTLDDIRDEIKKPLDDWKAAEKNRIASHNIALDEMAALGTATDEYGNPLKANTLRHSLKTLEIIQMGESQWEEFVEKAMIVKSTAMNSLRAAIINQEKIETEQIELERLRQEKKERDRIEYEENIAKKAAQHAKNEAEKIAEQEKLEFERRERNAKAAVAKAEQDQIAAAEQAERERLFAIKQAEIEKKQAVEEAEKKAEEEARQRERNRLAKKRIEQAETERRAADEQNRQRIINEMVEDMELAGYAEAESKEIVGLIISGVVRHIKINY